MAVVRSHSLSVGIVGLPNSGKSTLFNSLTKCGVPAENYPFCTIDKNVGVVKIPDSRLDQLATFFKAEKVVPSAMTFVDIAGLVKGASKGEGLGNQFLSHIREVDVVIYVLRAFSGESVAHVYERIDPLDDLKIVESELILKDIETVEKKLSSMERMVKGNAPEIDKKNYETLKRLLAHLSKGLNAIEFEADEEFEEFVHELWLLTNKKRIYLLNVFEGAEDPLVEARCQAVKDYLSNDEKSFVVKADVKLIGDLSEMSGDDLKEYLEMLSDDVVLLDDIIKLAYKRLDLLTFYTGSQKECNAWTIQKGASVVEAIGVVHTDLARTFITADVINVEKLIGEGGWVNAKEKGLIRNYGKPYIVEDGDYIVAYCSEH